MSKIVLLTTEANGNLSSSKKNIEDAVRMANDYAFSKLGIEWDINVLVTNRLYNIIIPEDGVGGRTHSSDFIEFAINEEKASVEKMSEMLVHELCHAARWGKNDEWINCLFDNLINEGISTYFEAEFVKDRDIKQMFIETVIDRSDDENERILERLRDSLDSNYFDYDMIFFNGNDSLPRWSGYSLGYYLVKKYLEKTDKKIEEAFADKYADFRIVLCFYY